MCEDLSQILRTPLPRIDQRVGIDPGPLSLAVDEDRLWLKSCLWAEERRRHERFDAIMRAEPSWPPVTVLAGTVGERLSEALAMVDQRQLTVVMNTWVAAYFTSEERTGYFDYLMNACATKNVAWISVESPLIAWPGIDENVDSPRLRSASQIVVSQPPGAPVRWGWCHAHGRWLERTVVA